MRGLNLTSDLTYHQAMTIISLLFDLTIQIYTATEKLFFHRARVKFGLGPLHSLL